MADETKTPAELKELTEALKQYKKVVKETMEIEAERTREQKLFYSAIRKEIGENADKLEESQRDIENQLATDKLALQEAKRTKDAARQAELEAEIELSEKKIEVYKKVIDAQEDSADQVKKLMKEQIEAVGSLSSAFSDLGTEVEASAFKTIAAMKLLGLETPNFVDEARKAFTVLDDARRELIPFSRTVAEANDLQNSLAERFAATRIPITDLGDAAQKASSDFSMFSVQGAEVQSRIAGFAAQLTKLGVQGGGSLIESIIADTGVENARSAIGVLEGLTMQMKELGVTPQQLFNDFNKLIGSFAMFGEAAATNIAKVSFMAQDMRVDVGTLTGFADNFSGYTGAARAAQRINAVFGANIIDNPAELVRTYYTSGAPGVALLVKQKLVDSGIDIAAALEGPAGAARAAALQPLLGDPQQARRFLLAETDTETIEAIGAGQPADFTKAFADFVTSTLTQAKQIEGLSENMAVSLLKEMVGVSLGATGVIVDQTTADLAAAFQAKIKDFAASDVFKIGKDKIQEILSGADEALGAETSAQNITPTSPAGIGATAIAVAANAEQTKNLTGVMERMITAVDKLETAISEKADEPPSTSSLGVNQELSVRFIDLHKGVGRFIENSAKGIVA